MAPDAVVRLVERADEIGARVGELESIAAAQLLRRQPEARHAIRLRALGVDEMLRVDLRGLLEEHSTGVLAPAGLGLERPGRVTHRFVEGFGVRGLVVEPPSSPSASAGLILAAARRCTNCRLTT